MTKAVVGCVISGAITHWFALAVMGSVEHDAQVSALPL